MQVERATSHKCEWNVTTCTHACYTCPEIASRRYRSPTGKSSLALYQAAVYRDSPVSPNSTHSGVHVEDKIGRTFSYSSRLGGGNVSPFLADTHYSLIADTTIQWTIRSTLSVNLQYATGASLACELSSRTFNHIWHEILSSEHLF